MSMSMRAERVSALAGAGLALTLLAVLSGPHAAWSLWSPWTPWTQPANGPAVPALAELGPMEVLMREITTPSSGDREVQLRLAASRLHCEAGRCARGLREAELARQAALGVGGEWLVEAQLAMGRAWMCQGRFHDARRDLEAAALLGAGEHAGVLHLLGNVRRELGHIDDAVRLYAEAQRGALARGAAEELPSIAADLGEALARKGDGVAAIAQLHRASALRVASEPPLPAWRDPEVARADMILGGALQQKGETVRAMEVLRKALRVQVRTLRPGHPDLVATRLLIAQGHRSLGDLSTSRQLVDEVVVALRKEPQEGPDLARALVLKADLLRDSQEFMEAELAAREALGLQMEAFGSEEHPEVAVANNELGNILHDQSKLTEAYDRYTKALEVNLKTVGTNNPETAATHNSLGTLYQDAGNDEVAKQHFMKCLEIQLHTVGSTSPDVSNTFNNLATVLFRQGKRGEAAVFLRKAIAVLDAAGVPPGTVERELYEENLKEITAPPSEDDGEIAAGGQA